jgi:type III restriction enzyme
MALHPDLPTSPYDILPPEQRWFPADESLRERAYERLLPPLVANVRREVAAWRAAGCADGELSIDAADFIVRDTAGGA